MTISGLFSLAIPAIFFGGFGLLLYFVIKNGSQQRKVMLGNWGEIAAQRGLTLSGIGTFEQPELNGIIDGHRVKVDLYSTGGKNKTTYTRVQVRPPMPMPKGLMVKPEGPLQALGKLVGAQDIQVGDPKMDARLVIRGRNETDVAAFLKQADLSNTSKLIQSSFDELSEGGVALYRRGRLGTDPAELHRLIDQAVALSQSANEARVACWRSLGERDGLELTWDGLTARATGVFEGYAVTLAGDPKRGQTMIVAELKERYPPGFRVEKGTCDLGDPILDRMVSVDGADVEDLRRLMDDDDLREDLLTVVHGFEGSWVDHDKVTMRMWAFTDGDLEERVRDAVRLARSLDRRAVEASFSGQAQRRRAPPHGQKQGG